MMMKANKQIGFIYKNNESIDKILKDGDVVFEKGFLREKTSTTFPITFDGIGKNLKDYKIYGNSVQRLPQEYQEVEYLKGSGTQYIDTGVMVDNTSKFLGTELEFQIVTLSATNVSMVCGAVLTVGSSTYTRLQCIVNNGVLFANGGFSFSDTDFYQKVKATYTDATTALNIGKTFLLFARNRSTASVQTVYSTIKMFSCAIKYDGQIVRNFIPCYRKSDSKPGMYDLVTETFYTNSGIGEFTVGANVYPTPSKPIEIESVGEKTKNLFNYKTASTQKGSFDNNGVFHATDNDNRDNLIYKIQLYNGNTMVTNSSRNISITGTGTYRITSPALIQSETTRIRFANHGSSIEFSINCDIDGSQFVGQYASIVFTVDDATVGASVISDIMFYVGNEPFDYEPYGYKIPVNVRSDNLATNLGFGWYSGANQKFTISYDFKRCIAKIKPNTTYTISKKNASNRFVVITSELEIAPNVSYKRVVLAEQNTNITQYTFTTREDENYLFFGYYRGTDETEIELAEEEMMIVEGSTAPSKYIPYYNETTNIYLDEPLRKVGNYADYIDFLSQKVFRNVIVNDDTGTQTIENSYTGNTDSSGTSISLPNIPTIDGNNTLNIETEITPSQVYIKYKSNE